MNIPDQPELVTLTELTDANLAEIIKIALADEGIRCVIEGEHQAGMTGALPIRLLVGDGDLERAEEILHRHADPDEDKEEPTESE
jgi:hypothetical protein